MLLLLFNSTTVGTTTVTIDKTVKPIHDRHIRRSGDDYLVPFSELLPQGIAWPRMASSVLMRMLKGMSQIWGYVDNKAALLLEIESDPRITSELLPEWERAFGLPDLCLSETLTIGDRRTALIMRMTLLGRQDREFFIKIALQIGYVISITEFRPFMVGIDRVGDNRQIGVGTPMVNEFGKPLLNPRGLPVALDEYSEYPYMLGPDTNRFYWIVHVATARLTWFRAAAGQVGIDPHLRIGIASDLECLLNRYKPGHTEIIFDYSGLTVGGSLSGTP
jgi:uncharacterized protein YmfQ (DUF2313 family)